MDVHKNARTTPRSREFIVARALSGESARSIAEDVGVCESTVRKWLRRDGAEGRAGLEDRSCRPQRSPLATPPPIREWIERLRRQRWTSAEIARHLQLGRAPVARRLRRRGWGRLAALEPAVEVQRYEWAHPGDLVHVDVKKLGRIGRIGHRITGDRRRQVRGMGWEYVHVAVDDASRLVYVEILGAEDAPAATAFLWRALAWFRRHGIRVRRLMTDNAFAYGSRLWLHFYNWHRGHSGLHGEPPVSRLRAANLVRLHS